MGVEGEGPCLGRVIGREEPAPFQDFSVAQVHSVKISDRYHHSAGSGHRLI
jgi:hypothetical protein